MKKLKKTLLALLVLFYLGITITIDIPENPPAQSCQADTEPFGPFDEGSGGKH